MKWLSWLVASFLFAAVTSSPASAASGDGDADLLFLQTVGPLFKERCLGCHGDDPKKLRGGLDLRSREAMLQGGESGEPAVVAGLPDESLLYLAARRDALASAMPPKENDKLSDAEVAALRAWIAGGAPWPIASARKPAALPRNESEGEAVATSGGLSPDWTGRKYKPADLWPYRPLSRSEAPAPSQAGSAHPIDAFLDEVMSGLGVTPAPMAERPALIRRAAHDLTGLPPAPEEVSAFVADPSPDEIAFARVVDRLLASPHYGERWGRHWLDVARYADSSGFANDYERGNAWRYRDYVVRAFNQDKPYAQFVREQIAGDELDPKNPEAIIATGFLRMGPWELTGMEVAKVARQKYLDDVTDAVGQAFLAHPLQCARCHDHKFDPIPTRDYYGMQAIFATTQLAERKAPFLPEENTRGFEEKRYLQERRGAYQKILADLDAKEESAARAWCEARNLPYVPRARGLREGVSEDRLPPKQIGFGPRDFGLERIGRKGLERLGWEFERYEPFALAVYDGRTPNLKAVNAPLRIPKDRATAGEWEQTSILVGGDPFSPSIKVDPAVLSVVAGVIGEKSAPLNPKIANAMEGRRSALAAWLTAPENPLPPRVMVNRIWLWHFGQAIAGNPNNFGATGKKPTHPKLLDWLADQFLKQGGSVKSMHRLIMSSAAYRRSSRHPDQDMLASKDTNQISYAAFRPRRLTAEEIRDAMLRVSGELNPELGGIPVRPELNPEVALQPRQVMGTFASAWQPSTSPSRRHRRSIYVLVSRGLLDPFFEVFNQPSPDAPCEARESSIVTPQVFSLFNSQGTQNRALALAARVIRETSSPAEAIARAFELAFARRPTARESRACLAHWRAMAARHRTLRLSPAPHPHEVTREAVEENTGVKFTYNEILESARNFVPDLRPDDVSPEVRGLMEVCLVLFNANEFVYLD